MSFWAIVKNGKVQSVFESDSPAAHMSKDVLKDVYPCGVEVKAGWYYNGTSYSGPTAQDIAKKEANDILEARTDALLDQIDRLMDILEGYEVITQADVDEVRSIGT